MKIKQIVDKIIAWATYGWLFDIAKLCHKISPESAKSMKYYNLGLSRLNKAMERMLSK